MHASMHVCKHTQAVVSRFSVYVWRISVRACGEAGNILLIWINDSFQGQVKNKLREPATSCQAAWHLQINTDDINGSPCPLWPLNHWDLHTERARRNCISISAGLLSVPEERRLWCSRWDKNPFFFWVLNHALWTAGARLTGLITGFIVSFTRAKTFDVQFCSLSKEMIRTLCVIIVYGTEWFPPSTLQVSNTSLCSLLPPLKQNFPWPLFEFFPPAPTERVSGEDHCSFFPFILRARHLENGRRLCHFPSSSIIVMFIQPSVLSTASLTSFLPTPPQSHLARPPFARCHSF